MAGLEGVLVKVEANSPRVSVMYWDGENANARVVRTLGLRVVLFYTADGHPTMHVDREEGTPPSEDTKYEDELMMRWNRAVLDQIRSASPTPAGEDERPADEPRG